RRRHTRSDRDWSSDVCSSDLALDAPAHQPTPAFADRGSSKVCSVTVTVAIEPPSSVRAPPCTKDSGVLGEIAANRHPDRSDTPRSEERRVGKECRSRWGAEPV